MQGLNLSKFKKVSGDKNVSVLKHPEGHEIRVFHAALKPDQRKALEKMPVQKLADGGEASQFTPDSVSSLPEVPQDPNSPQTLMNMSTSDIMNRAKQDLQPQNVSQVAPDTTSPSDAPSQGQPAAQQDPTLQSPELSGYNQTLKGLAQQRDVSGQIAQQAGEIEKSDIDARQDLLDGLKRNTEDFNQQQQQFLQDVQNGHIDPKHYQENQSVGAKVGTAIGLLLGGWSSGYTHQGNPALEFLNKQIDRDIEGQKANLDNKKTLFSANQALYHDNVLATNATLAQMQGITLAKIKQAADQLGTPQAQAAYNMAAGEYKTKMAANLQQSAIRATVLHSAQQGGQGLDAQSLAAAGLMTPQEAEKEQTSINSQKTAIDATKSLFDSLNKEQTAGNLLNPQSYARHAALHAELVNAVMNASASKRLTRESVEQEIAPLDIKTQDTEQTRKAKFDGMLNIIGRHADPTPNMSKYAPKSVPQYPFNAPAAAPTKTVNGVTYTKGPNGQAVPVK